MFNKAIDLIHLARQNGIEIILNDEQLQLKVPQNKNIDKNLLEEIRNNKKEIIEFLSNDDWKSRRINKNHHKINRFDRDLVKRIPLSFSQERLWLVDQLEGSVQYHVPMVLRMKGDLNREALNYALQTIVGRHESLRTVFREEDGQPWQYIKDKEEWQLSIIDGHAYQDSEDLQRYIHRRINEPFRLSEDYMIRASLIALDEREHVLVVTMHHIASDAWSLSIIVKEVVELYSASVEGRAVRLTPLELQYADYAIWQRELLDEEELDKKTDYWKKKLQGVTPLLLPADYGRVAAGSTRGATTGFRVDKQISVALQMLSQQQGTTLFMTLLAAFKALLYRYSGQQDICVGTSIAGREQQDVEGLIGFFANTLALRTEVSGDALFTGLLQQVRTTTLEAYEHQELPFEKVVDAVVREREVNRNPLFEVMFVLQNTPEVPQLHLADIQISLESFTQETSKFGITFFMTATPFGLQGTVQYSTDLYKEETIVRMMGHFMELLGAIVKDPGQRIATLQILTPAEQQLLTDMNDSRVEYPRDRSVVDIFERQAALTPDALAVVFEHGQLSFRELNERSNQLAHYLRSQGVQEETLVPIFMERSVEMIVGVLGILKAGGAYVPMETDHPWERIKYMLEDTGARIVVSSRAGSSRLPDFAGIEVIEIDDESSALRLEPSGHVHANVGSDHLAYVIYTSGSTGRPKGVMIEHRNLVDYVYGLKQTLQIDECRSFALVSTIATDLGNTVIYSSLLLGGCLHVFSKEGVSDTEGLHRYFSDKGIDCLKIVPSHWKALSGEGRPLLPGKLLIFGGEALQSELVKDLKLPASGCRIVNHYGPTETTIGKLLHVVSDRVVYGNTIPIGKPFSNTKVYVLTKDLQVCPIGVWGELYIEGDGVARGYMNNRELTGNKFISNPFISQGGRMYRTGDLVKYLSDGNIEFIGRIDDQVKIRGYRIELGEIESVLEQSELVSQAVVLAREDIHGDRRLVGYIVGAQGWFDREGILSYLRDKFPEYMIPALWVALERLPLTANGKIDRKALPDPDAPEGLSGRYVAARNEQEAELARIWQEVLEIDQVGIHDDFFELGGHSLLAVRLISAIRRALSVEMPIGDIFDYPTIASLSAHLDTPSGATLLPPIRAGARPERLPLSFSQERLWFIDRLEGSVSYHVPAVIRLKGNLNRDALEHALQMVVSRHEVLRTVLGEQEGQGYQSIRDKEGWHLDIMDGHRYHQDAGELHLFIQQLITRPFDLSKDYMIRGDLITLGPQEDILVVTMHHIASDGWSRSVLVREIVELYGSYVEGRRVALDPLRIQYADYAIWQRKYLEGEVLDKKLSYWKEKLRDVSLLDLPTDYVRPVVKSMRGAITGFSIDKELSEQLQLLSQQQGATLFMTLLTAFKVMLYRYKGQQDICVGSAVAGRQQEDLEELIGFFVNTLALRSEVSGNASFIELLQQVRKTTLEAYENGEAPFEKVVELMVKERDINRNPLFQVMFVLQNTPEVPELRLGEVLLSQEGFDHTTSKFEIFFSMMETPMGLHGSVEYSTDLYREETIGRMMGHFRELLRAIVKQPAQKIGALPMLTQAEEHQLLVEFNDTGVEYPKTRSIVDLFEEQVLKTPQEVAVVFEEEQLTYHQLNERSNQLAHYLRSRGVKEETLVPLCMDRSIEMMVAIIGILKSGGAYMPVDPHYPADRIRFMLEDSGAIVVVSSTDGTSKLAGIQELDIIELDGQWPEITRQAVTNLQIPVGPHQLAYVIYTSGSTGTPKGVMIEHGNVVSLVKGIHYVSLGRQDVLLSTGSPSFDATTFEYWGMLLNGGQLVLCSENRLLDSQLLKEEIESRGVNKMWFTSSWFNQLVKTDISVFEKLETILVGGEKLSEQHIRKLRQTYPFMEIINGYGPTENTTFSLTYRITDTGLSASIPIGRPLSNRRAYVLDEKQQLVGVGVGGEICLGGAGLGRGYLNRPALTAEKFIADPFSKEPGARIYKTGDLGRWLGDGNIEYLGRMDEQVKIQGYRIELGEVESALNELEPVSSCCVVVRQDPSGINRLVSYYVPNAEVVKAKERELYHHQVANWKELYEIEYGQTEGEKSVDEEFNIIGWKDSFTGQPIASEQMQEWLQDIVEVIGQPEHVLEIGCGTGLIYYQLAGKVKKYIGTDFSRSSINQITQRISKGLRDYGPTELQVCAAHEVSLGEEEQVDTIILNSIVQYFPGEDYMNTVLSKSISLLKGRGRIIIGDVRDNRLLKLFKGRLIIQKLQDSVSIKEFTWTLDQEVLKEEELCFSPEYFYRLRSSYPQITHIEIQWKQGSYINELTLYRYTVVIYVGVEKELIEPQWQSWEELGNKQHVISQLQEGYPTVALRDVPNPRLWQERLIDQALEDKSVSTVGDLLNSMEVRSKESEQISQILKMAQAGGYRSRFLLGEDPLKINVLMELEPSGGFIQGVYSGKGYNTHASTNVPLFTDIRLLLQKDIRSLLQHRLPEYMVPSEFIALARLPLTSHGKVDKRFLSQREDRAAVNKLNYQPPRTQVEQTLANIWQELLGLERVGIHDNFFELGGHSLLAMRVVSQARRAGYQLQSQDIFLHQTIGRLSLLLEERPQAALSEPGTLAVPVRKGECIIPIQMEGTEIPFFAIHDFWQYRKLSHYLGKNQPFYCLEGSTSNNLEDIAAHYVNEIKIIQPNGPYLLGGFCRNGKIALEMAHLLVAQGEKVAVLALFELYSLEAMRHKRSKYLKLRTKRYFDKLSGMSPKEVFPYFKKEINTIFSKIKGKIYFNKITNQVIKPYSGKVVLFKATDYDELYFNSDIPHMGWSNYFTGDINMFEIEGTHGGDNSIFNEPGVVQLAEKLRTILEDANSQNGTNLNEQINIHSAKLHSFSGV